MSISAGLALLAVPEPSALTKIAGSALIGAGVTGLSAVLLRLTNIIASDEVIPDKYIRQLEAVSFLLDLVGAVFALPEVALRYLEKWSARKAAAEAAKNANPGRGVWDTPGGNAKVGLAVEGEVVDPAKATPRNFKTYDEFADGTATSWKTWDGAVSCEANFRSTVNKGINDKLNFDKYKTGDYALDSSMIKNRVLKIAVPKGAKPSQSLIDWAKERGQLNDVVVEIVEVAG